MRILFSFFRLSVLSFFFFCLSVCFYVFHICSCLISLYFLRLFSFHILSFFLSFFLLFFSFLSRFHLVFLYFLFPIPCLLCRISSPSFLLVFRKPVPPHLLVNFLHYSGFLTLLLFSPSTCQISSLPSSALSLLLLSLYKYFRSLLFTFLYHIFPTSFHHLSNFFSSFFFPFYPLLPFCNPSLHNPCLFTIVVLVFQLITFSLCFIFFAIFTSLLIFPF